jgi:Protein of unknown function (DUF2924)
MDAGMAGQIAQLRALSRQQLLNMWQKLYDRAAPPGIRRELLVPFLAYRMQEHAYGGLKSSARSELRRIARDLEKSTGSTRLILRPKIKAGTRLLREWRGQTHEVIATESGYEYCGVGYRSLSEIARKVTGTRWSGPAFFGLKNAKSALGLRDD